MLARYKKYIEIEWSAQRLQEKFEKEGPLIEIISKRILTSPVGTNHYQNIHYLIIQGSFDPPTNPHLKLILNSVKLKSKQLPLESIRLVILFSLAHVDKTPDVLYRSLLGERVEMMDHLINHFDFNVSVFVGLSNVARYIDLIRAMKKTFKNIGDMTFIMGMDVFKKIFDPIYYSTPLNIVLPKIFEAKYIVAGRNDIILEEEFNYFYTHQLQTKNDYLSQIEFLPLPEDLRNVNSTQIRETLSRNQLPDKSSLPLTIFDFLEKNNLYLQNIKNQVMRIIIQTGVNLSIKAQMDSSLALIIIDNLIREVQDDNLLLREVIDEYKSDIKEENKYIYKRWEQLHKSNILKN